jgi:hypothetical protein
VDLIYVSIDWGATMPISIYIAAAAGIALAAFGIGQAHSGLGMPFVGLATTMWAVVSAKRRR